MVMNEKRFHATTNRVLPRTVQSLVPYDFYGTELQCAPSPADRQVWTAMVHFCRALGVNFSTQSQKVQEYRWASKGVKRMTIPSAGGPQEMLMIEVKYLPWWLNSIHPKKVADSVRPQLERFQDECASALAEHFLGEAITQDKRSVPMTQAALTTFVRSVVADLIEENKKLVTDNITLGNELATHTAVIGGSTVLCKEMRESIWQLASTLCASRKKVSFEAGHVFVKKWQAVTGYTMVRCADHDRVIERLRRATAEAQGKNREVTFGKN